ncbi:hypothetical protein C8Q76DRAFT_785657 [Earliella scabrosa]|nr:hypothetical protein C8Q76DRAFT_785657 [Earliella scabrosa]
MSSTDGDDTLAAIISFVDARYTYNLGILSATAILLYDTIITYENEFQLLWQRKIGIVALLHVFNRYTRILAYVSSVALFPKLSDNVCQIIGTFQEVAAIAPYIPLALFAAFRAYALSSRNLVLTIVVLVLNIVFIAPNVYFLFPTSVVNQGPLGCLFQYNGPSDVAVVHVLVWMSRSSLILGECVVLALTLKVVHQAQRSFRHREVQGASLTGVLLVNGVTCFIVPLVLNIALLIVYALQRDGNISGANQQAVQFLTVARDTLTCVLISRFLLDLGKLNQWCAEPTQSLNLEQRGVLTTHVTTDVSDLTFILPPVDPRE